MSPSILFTQPITNLVWNRCRSCCQGVVSVNSRSIAPCYMCLYPQYNSIIHPVKFFKCKFQACPKAEIKQPSLNHQLHRPCKFKTLFLIVRCYVSLLYFQSFLPHQRSMTSRFFENPEPNEICSHIGSEKILKRRQTAGFFKAREAPKTATNEGKGRDKKKQ